MTKPAKTFAEFFAGIGLVRLGLERAGWSCIYANDNDPKKQQQYEARFGEEHFHLCDVFKLQEMRSLMPSNVRLATASFPCTDLSLAGHWKGIEGRHSSAVFGFLECIEDLGRPPILLLENVVGLLSSKQGQDFRKLSQLLGDAGYWLDAFRLDARHFVPQSRPRIFFVGVHDSHIEDCPFTRSDAEFTLGENDWESLVRCNPELRPARLVELMATTELATGWFCSEVITPKATVKRLGELIDLGEDELWWDDVLVKKHYDMMSGIHRSEVDRLQCESSLSIGTIYRRKRHGKTRAEVRFDGTAGCLRTPKGGSARQIVIVVEPDRIRMKWMTPVEYARLQGADDFPLVGRTNQQLFGFGDAVCVPAIEWIGNRILNPIIESIELASSISS
ncbi:DNA cytosine methyltransferase [Neorhodopirellula pilleata]|uniref:DNA (cytosine-5-)-methyltransferase n=1 Tax=Neorhodopirellula pilleata TaxID=2714738 RepID=A0A5C6A073_9BACT|nr:DNA cytosine methyltransferase [Neorhodopirellula pilleata]TWT91933.1 Modification methylase HpaII [Neorhodopirellula pilleata]